MVYRRSPRAQTGISFLVPVDVPVDVPCRDTMDLSRRHFRVNSANAPVITPPPPLAFSSRVCFVARRLADKLSLSF